MTDPAKQQARRRRAPAGAVDEFAHIPRRRTRHPLITLAGALLAFFLVFYGRRDLRYALSSGEPLELGVGARRLFTQRQGRRLTSRTATCASRGTPDRESALELDTKGSWVFSQLFRVLGTGDRLFVHRMREPVAGGARRGGRVRGPADPHRRAALRRRRSAATSPST